MPPQTESSKPDWASITPPQERHFGPYVVSRATLLQAGFDGFFHHRPSITLSHADGHIGAYIGKELNGHRIAIIRWALNTAHVKWSVAVIPAKSSDDEEIQKTRDQDQISRFLAMNRCIEPGDEVNNAVLNHARRLLAKPRE